jgi:Putative zinc-finger
MLRSERVDDHQKFRELAALSLRGALSDGERLDLKRHLEVCSACQRVYDEYALISTEGMNFLATAYGYDQQSERWDDRPVRRKLLARVRDAEMPEGSERKDNLLRMGGALPPPDAARWAALAACVLVSVAVGAYHLGSHVRLPARAVSPGPTVNLQDVTSHKASEELIIRQAAQLSLLQHEVTSDGEEVARLRSALHAAEAHSAALTASSSEIDEQLREVSGQRDKLTGQLREAEDSYKVVQAELTTLRAEHDRVLLRTTSLESKVDELSSSTRDQERKIRDDEQYLASDRDIRELMGARKLYIADVFDVDSGSRTRKPFGRVFYTQSKSLIFYAFDLDRQPGIKNASASAFQVWGQSDAEVGQKSRAMNLGILYMDSESNRRWVLRLDDPKQLAEIDAVFVTVEPNGGSQKPTGKPFLYALLRREANHP